MDAGLLPTLGLGFLFGLQHATDPDHVVAVATIVSRTRRFDAGALIGAFWGVGHTATIVTVGMAIIVFNLTVTPSLGLSLELVVAVMLLVLGVFRIVRLVRDRDSEEQPPETDAPMGFRSALQSVGRVQAARSIGIGFVHGLAGSAAVALLVLSTVKSPYAAAAYLLLFGLGTIVGMTVITALLSLPFRVPLLALNRGLAIGTGVGSFVFGLFLIVQIGFVDGLFLRH
ncbi:MAG TPA: sulfite exporter TauE/SafE family protein [Terriglobales bacterium]|nr:sulfite exporter TauE/SafE family protein [Terriglobales bacterium]